MRPPRTLWLFLVAQLPKARVDPSPLHALPRPGPRLAQGCAYPPAGLSDEALQKLHAQLVQSAQALAAELQRRKEQQAASSASTAEPR